MKKIIYPIIVLAAAGVFFSVLLLLEHYNPDVNLGFLSCSTTLENPCIAVSSSPWAEVLGIPTAALGIFFYLFIFFTVLIVEDAKGDLYRTAAGILLPFILLSLLIDLFLLSRLVAIDAYCRNCIITYGINLLLCAAVAAWFVRVKRESGMGLRAFYGEYLWKRNGNPYRRASVSTFALAMILLFCVVAVASIRIRPRQHDFSAAELRGFIQEFYKLPQERLDLPGNGLVTGNPKAKVTIVIFSDYLCSACYEFYKIERFLLSKYRDRVKMVNYIFPLDVQCNRSIKRTLYRDSCNSSRAVLAASKLGIMEEFVVQHFKRYPQHRHGYPPAAALANLQRIGHGTLAPQFAALAKSPEIEAALQEHIGISAKNRIDATPTFFIAGRRLVGIPQQNPRQLIEAIVLSEILKSEGKR
ncbi:MAG: thioredoxin domain-containing protein [Spirochaetes bacterium]|nr:thioredoxin domain-containing protein [Spirochaetota bacterium]